MIKISKLATNNDFEMENALIKSENDYTNKYKQSTEKPESFWEEIAENFTWFKKWDNVYKCNMESADFKWFEGAKTNISFNCIDRHLEKKGDKTAIIFEPNNPNEEAKHISFKELHQEVNKMANVLLNNGIKKGDRVCIYLPMIPELAISVLACARIGAIHSVVFAGFSSIALATRIQDSSCKTVITSDGGYRGAKTLNLKKIVDDALISCKSIESVLVVKRTNEYINMQNSRDFWLHEELEKASSSCEAAILDSEDPFLSYIPQVPQESQKG